MIEIRYFSELLIELGVREKTLRSSQAALSESIHMGYGVRRKAIDIWKDVALQGINISMAADRAEVGKARARHLFRLAHLSVLRAFEKAQLDWGATREEIFMGDGLGNFAVSISVGLLTEGSSTSGAEWICSPAKAALIEFARHITEWDSIGDDQRKVQIGKEIYAKRLSTGWSFSQIGSLYGVNACAAYCLFCFQKGR